MTATHAQPRRTYRFTVDEVLRMVDAGLLSDPRVELLDGELVRMTAKGPFHVYVAAALHRRLDRALPDGWHARKEDPMVTSPNSAPEPDVSVIRGAQAAWRDRLPTGADCALAVEVSVGTLAEDREKLALYARGGVPEVWILDVLGRRVERHADPVHGEYAVRQVFVDGEQIAVPVVGECWAVASFFD